MASPSPWEECCQPILSWFCLRILSQELTQKVSFSMCIHDRVNHYPYVLDLFPWSNRDKCSVSPHPLLVTADHLVIVVKSTKSTAITRLIPMVFVITLGMFLGSPYSDIMSTRLPRKFQMDPDLYLLFHSSLNIPCETSFITMYHSILCWCYSTSQPFFHQFHYKNLFSAARNQSSWRGQIQLCWCNSPIYCLPMRFLENI